MRFAGALLRPVLAPAGSRREPDWTLAGAVLLLTGVGLVMILSASYVWSHHHYDGDAFRFLRRQALFAAVGIPLLVLAYRADLSALRRLSAPLLLLSLALLVAVFVPGLGRTLGGARRWIGALGFTFQPAEFFKLALVWFLSDWLARNRREVVTGPPGVLLPPAVACAFGCVMLLLQPDFGSCAIVCLLAAMLTLVGGVRLRLFATAAAAAVPLLVLAMLASPYRRRRLFAFLDPAADPRGSGFQILQSLIALGAGGLTGAGLSKGMQKLFYLPMPHTDFVFAVVGEETGFLGCAAVVLLFAVVAWRGFSAALRSRDAFQALLATGLTLLLSLQAVVNMAVVCGLLPTKGIPLPFVSFGGSSLVVNLAAAGLLLNVTSRVRE